jgi:hypothetical protein
MTHFYWISIAAGLCAAGCSLQWGNYVARDGKPMWQATARPGDGRYFISRADDLNVAFLHLAWLVVERSTME